MQKVSKGALRNSGRFDAIEQARPTLNTEAEFVTEINRLANRVDETYWTIGELLIEAKRKLQISDELWSDWVDTHLRFNRQTAFKIMQATMLLKSGEIPSELLPPNYTLVYEIAVIPTEYRQRAVREGAFRADMRRSDITQLKRTLLPAKTPKRRTRRAIQAELRRLDEEEARIARRRAELEQELKSLTETLVRKSA